MIKKTFIAALLVGAVYFLLSSHLELTVAKANVIGSTSASYALPQGPTIQIAALNYRTAASDLVWINSLLYIADRMIRRISVTEITDFADAIVYLDPHFYPIYQYHSATRRMLNIHMSYEDVAEANRILEIGMEHFPRDYRFPFSIAVNHVGVIYQRTPEERLQDLENIVYYSQRAVELAGNNEHVLLFATAYQRRLLRARAGLSEYAEAEIQASPEELDFLIRTYYNTADPQTRGFLLRRLYELGAGDELVRQAEEFRRQFDLAHGASHQYLSGDLFSLTAVSLYTYGGTEALNPSPPADTP